MTEPAVTATAYVTEEAFSQAVDGLQQSIDGLAKRVDEQIEKVRQSVIGEASKRITREREQRERDISKLRDDMTEISRKTDDKLAQIDEKLDSLGSSIGTLNEQLAKLDGTIGSWKVALDANHEMHDNNRDRINEIAGEVKTLDKTVDDLKSDQNVQRSNHDALYRTIHGRDGEDGPESLFAMLHNLNTSVMRRFDHQDEAINAVKQVALTNSELVQKIEGERLAQAERWQQRRETASKFAHALISSRPFWAIVGAVAVGTILGIFPEAREGVLSVFEFLLTGE